VVDCLPEEREVNSLVLSLSQEEFDSLKSAVQDFSQKIFDEHPPKKNDSSTRVVQVSMQVFPLTRATGGKN